MRKTIILLALTLLVFAADRVYYQVGDTTPAVAFFNYGANFVYYHKFVNTQAGRLDSVSVFTHTAVGNLKAAIYTHNAGTNRPASIVDSSDVQAAVVDDWVRLAFANQIDVSADTFWIAVWGSGLHQRAKGEGGGINWGFQSRSFALGWLPSATLSGADNWDDVDIYITVSVAADANQQTKYIGFGGFKKY